MIVRHGETSKLHFLFSIVKARNRRKCYCSATNTIYFVDSTILFYTYTQFREREIPQKILVDFYLFSFYSSLSYHWNVDSVAKIRIFYVYTIRNSFAAISDI